MYIIIILFFFLDKVKCEANEATLKKKENDKNQKKKIKLQFTSCQFNSHRSMV